MGGNSWSNKNITITAHLLSLAVKKPEQITNLVPLRLIFWQTYIRVSFRVNDGPLCLGLKNYQETSDWLLWETQYQTRWTFGLIQKSCSYQDFFNALVVHFFHLGIQGGIREALHLQWHIWKAIIKVSRHVQ